METSSVKTMQWWTPLRVLALVVMIITAAFLFITSQYARGIQTLCFISFFVSGALNYSPDQRRDRWRRLVCVAIFVVTMAIFISTVVILELNRHV